MNRMGMMVDISHVADKNSRRHRRQPGPVIASTLRPRLAPSPTTDDMLRAVGKNGGVVETNFYSAFIDENYRKAAEAQKKDADAAVERGLRS